ncbi:histone-lysine N-methyltransferase EHMT2 [Amyelois transitella]|uniref:histone-lysine N-methyltransferase EHMT2 n=1 Tax=Amyelois transitella TaxID=680683 RepID=UPI0029907E1E|nr:histone-lysine N-methyltransferase EHMT2 [Amyelois transitella]
MLDEEGDVPAPSKKKLDKNQPAENVTVSVDGKKSDKSDTEDPKPRIVLTFRSDKSGSKNSNMKIVSSEDKHEEFSPRRSSRTRSKWEWTEDAESSVSPKKDKSLCVSENEEVSDSSIPKRSSRRRSKDSADNVLANAIARKEKYNETVPTQRLSRRIKPTAKILANEELRIGLESQNNARLGITAEEGVRTRRSARPVFLSLDIKDKTTKTVKVDISGDCDDSEMKLKHLCELGLKAKDTEAVEEEGDGENRESENECEVLDEDEEIDDDSEVISKLLEADDETISEGSDEDFSCSDEASQTEKAPRTRRSTRLTSSYGNDESEESSMVQDDDKTQPRRSSRRSTRHYYDEENLPENDPEHVPRRKKTRLRAEETQPEVVQEDSNPAGGEESEAACPEEDSAIVATCFCEATSNVYAAPDELTEPVFCQAIESVDGIRVGCSHACRREGGAPGAPAALLRAGPRAPYVLLCAAHAQLLRAHMCCPACGVFCTQGVFYQCSENHLFHLECGLPYNENKSTPGCPHCGVRSYRWTPANQRCVSVRVHMQCSNKRIYLPEQRQQCTPAYLCFSSLSEKRVTLDPIIPEDLLPETPLDLGLLEVKAEGGQNDAELLRDLKDAIVSGESAEQLIKKIAVIHNINQPVDEQQSSAAHVAARRGAVCALYALRCAGADLDACDRGGRTPLMVAVQALLAKDGPTKSKLLNNETMEDMEVDGQEIKGENTSKEDENEILNDTSNEEEKIKEETEILNNLSDQEDVVKETSKEEHKELEGDKKEINEDDIKEEATSQEEIDIKEEILEIREEEIKDMSSSGENETDSGVDEEELFKVIRFLLAVRCDVDFPGPEGMTALHMCSSQGGRRAEAVARELLAAGARAGARDRGGWTPLVWAAEHGHAGILRLLLQNGADATATDKEGNGVVHWCCLGGHGQCLQQLADSAPSVVEQANQHRDTPLHIAARHGHYSCVVILLARGARTEVTNCVGETPLDVCGHHDSCRRAISLNIQMAAITGASKHRLLCNDISRGREHYPLPCVNEIDDAPAPDDFTYVTANVMSENIVVDNTISTLQGCKCKDSCEDSSCSCCVLGVRRWYRHGKLLPDFLYHDPPMLFECNCTCQCNVKECANTVVSRLAAMGSLGVRAAVFRRAALGWGLRARTRVARGAPVALYCGELLAAAAADTRANDHYMFALDVKPDLLEQCSEKTVLCVDAARYGSAARFINHSCKPNLTPVRVYTSTRDLRLPTVALFACTDIQPGEELTFDYGDKFWSVKSKWMKCECGTPECRYPEVKEEDES